MHDLKTWAGTPTIFVLDCSAAGVLLNHFVDPAYPEDLVDRGDLDFARGGGGGGGADGSSGASVQGDMSKL